MEKYNLLPMLALAAGFLTLSATPASADAILAPYSISLTTQAELDTWTTYDVDGNVEGEKATWFLGNSDNGGPCAASYTDATTFKPTDNWLVSPAITLEAGKQYVLSFDYFTSYYYDEHVDILMSATPDPADPHTTIEESVLKAGYSTYYYGASKKVLLPVSEETGDYHFSLRHTDDGLSGMAIFVKNFAIAELSYGNLEVSVCEYVNGNEAPVEGATVKAEGATTLEAVTDANGQVTFSDIPEGDYSVTASKWGYSDSYPTTMTVKAGETTTGRALSLYPLDHSSVVTGRVLDAAGNAIEGAAVRLEGYASYRCTTDAEGSFRIENIYNQGYYQTMDYTLTVLKNNFETVTRTVGVRQDYYSPETNAGDITLAYKILAPYSVEATLAGASAIVNWTRPTDITEMAIDNGVANDALGFSGSYGTNVLGVVYPEPMRVTNLSWYRMSSENAETPSEQVNIFLIALDEKGNITDNILFMEEGIDSPLDTWTQYTLPQQVDAPNGVFVAMSAIGYMALGRDNNPEVIKGQAYANTYVDPSAYRFFDELDWKGALMLRAAGERYEEGSFEPEVLYTVKRVNAADETTVLAENLTATSYTDADFESLPQGVYRYAVETVYPVEGNKQSEPAYSNTVSHNMSTMLTVSVLSNSVAADAEGAVATLTSADNRYTATVEEGKAVFADVWKDAYTLSVKQPGFEADDQQLDLSTNAAYEASAELKQLLQPVDNIDYVTTGNSVTVSWDLFRDINESFEGDDFPDFEINPAGRMGWSYIDADGLPTYGFGATTFPGMRSPMAAIVMNSWATTPELKLNVARTGNRALGSFAPLPTEHDYGTQLNHSEDYIFTPRLDFHKDFTLTFSAMTYEDQEGRLETFRVGYTTSTPDVDNIEWVSGYTEAPLREYATYTYELPKEARYAVIYRWSDDVFLMLLDDFAIGTGIADSGLPSAVGAFNGYAVILDGEYVAETSERSITFDNLEAGLHTVSVVKLYNSGASDETTIEFSLQTGIDRLTAADTTISCTGRKLMITGSYGSASVYTPAGVPAMQGISGNQAVDLSSLAAGIYVVTTDNGVSARIVVK